jgi:hypothetical protein
MDKYKRENEEVYLLGAVMINLHLGHFSIAIQIHTLEQ